MVLSVRYAGCSELSLLDAAHLYPISKKGTDDPRNALVLCALHHRAFDRGLILIDPDSLVVSVSGIPPVTPSALFVEETP